MPTACPELVEGLVVGMILKNMLAKGKHGTLPGRGKNDFLEVP
jgi:hypothetical protein